MLFSTIKLDNYNSKKVGGKSEKMISTRSPRTRVLGPAACGAPVEMGRLTLCFQRVKCHRETREKSAPQKKEKSVPHSASRSTSSRPASCDTTVQHTVKPYGGRGLQANTIEIYNNHFNLLLRNVEEEFKPSNSLIARVHLPRHQNPRGSVG